MRGFCPGSFGRSCVCQRCSTFWSTWRRYQACGKSVTSRVMLPWPTVEPVERPRALAGGFAVGSTAVLPFSSAELRIGGSSRSPGRAITLREGNDASAGLGVSLGGFGCGSGGVGTRAGRGGGVREGTAAGLPVGAPTAATDGKRLTTCTVGCLSTPERATAISTATTATWPRTDTTRAFTGVGEGGGGGLIRQRGIDRGKRMGNRSATLRALMSPARAR